MQTRDRRLILDCRLQIGVKQIKKISHLEKSCKRGFTLVEVIMVMVVLAAIAGIGVASISTATDALSFLTIRSEMDQSADVAMGRMSFEIRRLRDDASISAAGANQFTFTDVDGTSIGYSLVGTDLIRTSSATSTSDILASSVSGLVFAYFDYSGNQLVVPVLAPLTNIRRIQVTITFQSGAYTFDYSSQIRPRNLRHLSYKFH
ncbi:type II secretion system protein [Thermoproteota archaeon]